MTLFGKLEEVDIRTLWRHEQYDFSSWLAENENIEQLGNILGLTLTNIKKEVYVGTYRCDLVGEDETSGETVVIENQLEISNHEHLGKIITYASGLNASTVVWIVKEAREEHRSAIAWLNNQTGENLNFFLIEIHAYRIGNSAPAPKFEIVEMPNDFIKSSKNSRSANDSENKIRAERLEFWNQFNDAIIAKGRPFNVRKATGDHWYDVAIGMSGACVRVTLVNKDGLIGIEMLIIDSKKLFDDLFSDKENIEKELGIKLDWQRLDDKKAAKAIYHISGLNFDDHSNYQKIIDDTINVVTVFTKVFSKYVKKYVD